MAFNPSGGPWPLLLPTLLLQNSGLTTIIDTRLIKCSCLICNNCCNITSLAPCSSSVDSFLVMKFSLLPCCSCWQHPHTTSYQGSHHSASTIIAVFICHDQQDCKMSLKYQWTIHVQLCLVINIQFITVPLHQGTSG